MQDDVKTVALTAAGHRVEPAAGSVMERAVQAVSKASNPSIIQGCSDIPCQESCRPGSIGGTKDMGTDINMLLKESTAQETCTDLRAHTKEPAWKHPASNAKT
mmetsp:Transcript_71055/g.169579  ORF Transcript_71055/g.169579 Transcript_71055/m.169579 type:complete len:103 (-) Transcript_71055:512-820(-)